MTATQPIPPPSEEPCERERPLDEAKSTVGPLRNPDACELLCPDCTCRRLLDERRARLNGQGS